MTGVLHFCVYWSRPQLDSTGIDSESQNAFVTQLFTAVSYKY